jgi:hypothetical protein
MALIGVNVDVRSNAGLTAENTLTFAHGLRAAPDIVRIHYRATLTTAAATRWYGMAIPVDAVNVTIINQGSTTSPDFDVMSQVLHTVIR